MGSKLREMAGKLGISLDDRQLEQFDEYTSLLLLWNQKMNLTTITDPEEIEARHYLDSLTAVKAVDLSNMEALSVLDIGSGAGFPGIPLKIAFPSLSVILLDARQKRVSFLKTVIEQLQLTDTAAVCSRAEDFIRMEKPDDPQRESHDLCVSRAVADLSVLAEYCLPYVKVGGYFLAYKSQNVGEELKKAEKAISKLGGSTEEVCSFTLPDTDLRRTIIKIKKIQPTDIRYPRKPGKPGKSPL